MWINLIKIGRGSDEMAYKICYGNKSNNYFYKEHKRSKMHIGTILVVLLLLVLFAGTVVKSDARKNAETALHKFSEDIIQGEEFANAVTAFCRDIIESANSLG